ncbi:ATP-binding protein [Streptomyces sp. NPDC014983]|uniref:sensor histidine kinase n=1 Tax=Streptomyces sp. NPDC014983 TaxID=3364933 RepID=UPI0036FD02CA
MTALIQDAALALLAPGFAGASVAAVRYRRTAHRRATENAELTKTLQQAQRLADLRDQELQHLARKRLPAMAETLWAGTSHNARQAVHPELFGTVFAQAEEELLQFFGSLTEQASTRAEQAARAAVQSVTRALQALVYEQQRAISSMIERHDDEKVLADAYEIDHACSQLARKAQIVGLLAGAWPGRQRDDTPLLDVVRGGVSRIRDYRRVRITGEPTEYVGSNVVEPVVLAVAELLDNAARNSQPGTAVEVYFVHAHNGVSIIIDDAGIGLTPETRADAQRLLAGKEPVRLTQLRNPPRLGFLGIGVLAERYGFRVSVAQQSDHGGVRAIVHLHRGLFVPAPAPAAPQAQQQAGGSLASSGGSRDTPSAPQNTGPYPVADDGLPMRRRAKRRHGQPPAQPSSQPPTDGGRNLAAFIRGTRAPHLSPTDEENTQ